MRRFRSILVVPVTNRPEPPPALKEAAALARTSGAKVQIVGHLPSSSAAESGTATREHAAFRDALVSAYRDRLSSWAAHVGAPDLPIEIVSGSRSVDVVDRVNREGHDLVVIASDGSRKSATAAHRILRTCPCPAWLLRPAFTGARVLAAIDPEDGDEYNRLILELAHSQATLHGGDLRLVHAWDVPGLDLVESVETDLDRAEISVLTNAMDAEHRARFEASIEAAGMAEGPETHLVEGDPARAIRGLAQLYRADLIVVGAGSWTQPQLGLGSTTEQVLAEAEASVLVVRPVDGR